MMNKSEKVSKLDIGVAHDHGRLRRNFNVAILTIVVNSKQLVTKDIMNV